MASPDYPAADEITQHDIDEFRMQAQKALMLSKSPHARVHVQVEANTLLRLLEMAEPKVRM